MGGAYYNEIDPNAAAWLRELVRQGHIAAGEVDERDIQDVSPADLRGFSQCHFFAGIGVWSYALRRAGWPDDRPVWTGSCPCQPFSSAGKGAGFDDERHLWPSFHWLIAQCRPAVVFGEQVASKDAEPWIDLVQADLEALAYAVGAIPFPSAGVGAPHIRDRLYWVADAEGERGRAGLRDTGSAGRGIAVTGDGGAVRLVGDAVRSGLEGHGRNGDELDRSRRVGEIEARPAPATGAVGELGDAPSRGRRELGDASWPREGRYLDGSSDLSGGVDDPDRSGGGERSRQFSGERSAQSGQAGGSAGPTNGLWRDADWLLCRDGKWRPVEPGTFPLAHGAAARVGRLRGYGNAINAEAAVAWIEAYLESRIGQAA